MPRPRKRPVKPGDLVEVTWLDACVSLEGQDDDDFGVTCKTAGYVVFHDKRGIRLSMTQKGPEIGGSNTNWDIPAVWLTAVRLL